jgi:hypothetical protein
MGASRIGQEKQAYSAIIVIKILYHYPPYYASPCPSAALDKDGVYFV